MDLTWVSATAIVKARDGSSIADWDESSGVPADHYLADPDRIKAAMRAVEDAGLTAGPVGDCTVSFSGTADQVSALFGTALDTTRPDSPAWAGGDDVLTLPTSQSLAPQLESIRLARVASHLGGRTYGAEYLPSSSVLDTDLLVGEVGQTLRASAPPRLERWEPSRRRPWIRRPETASPSGRKGGQHAVIPSRAREGRSWDGTPGSAGERVSAFSRSPGARRWSRGCSRSLGSPLRCRVS